VNVQIERLRADVCCYHEATVGAGLPVLCTLADLVETGDRVVRIEGILSGTLSFLFNSFSAPDNARSFSDLVREAKDRGYTVRSP
jgi:homoserine dehydrogenase